MFGNWRFQDDFRTFVEYLGRVMPVSLNHHYSRTLSQLEDTVDALVSFHMDGATVCFDILPNSPETSGSRMEEFTDRLTGYVDALNGSGRYARSHIHVTFYVYDTDFGIRHDRYGW